jgi:RND family efflux transporter MFP subunit
MDDTVLRAPFAGVMARKLVEDFQTVREKEVVLILQDTSMLEIKVAIPERDVAASADTRRTEDMTARVQPEVVVSSLPDTVFPARVTEFATTADPETRTFEATLRFDPQGARVFPGMTAKVIATPSRLSGLTWIPAHAAIANDDGQPFVWLVAPGTMTVRRAQVTLGELAGSNVQILSGLANGDQIAISGVHQLREGMEVRRFE